MFEVIKYLLTSQYVDAGETTGIFVTLWKALKLAFEQLKYLPDLLLSLPWWAFEIIAIFTLVFIAFWLDPIIENIKKQLRKKEQELTQGDFKL